MNNSILMIIITVFTQFIVFLACTFSPYVSPRGIFFGVKLDAQYKKDTTIKQIVRAYLFKCTTSFILLLGITIGYMILSADENQASFAMTLSTFVLLGLCFVFFVGAHNQIKAFAHTLQASLSQATKTVIDTDFIKEKNTLRKHFRKLYLIPLILIVFSIVYSSLNYASLPDMLPTHWNLWGEADAWQIKTPLTFTMYHMMQLLLCGVLYYASDQIFTTRGKLDSEHYELSKQTLLCYLKGMGYSMYSLTLSMILLFTLTSVSMVNGTFLRMGVIILGLIIPILSTLSMFIVWAKYRKNSPSHTSYSPEDDERHWIWASLYYNPDDPSLFVEKRYGIGWTINMGHPAGKVITVVTILILLGSIFLPLIVS